VKAVSYQHEAETNQPKALSSPNALLRADSRQLKADSRERSEHTMDFRLPALGEGIDAATVVGVRVSPGDAVAAGQEVIDVETDKAAVSVPVDSAGTVAELKVKPGDKVAVGGVLLVLSSNGVPKATGDRKADKASDGSHAAGPATSQSPPVPTKPADAESTGGLSASTRQEFKLPALGEGIDAATVVDVLIKPGDKVAAGQNVVAVETDKAAVEVPAESAGTVAEVKVKPGDKVPVGAVLLVLQASGVSHAAGSATPKSPPVPPKPADAGRTGGMTAAARQDSAHTRPASTNGPTTRTVSLVPGGPATRRLARELGVSLAEIEPSGRGGRVTLDDVKTFVRKRITEPKPTSPTSAASGRTVADSFAHPPLPDFAKFGPIEKKPVPTIRQTIAKNLTVAWRTMPMVTQHDQADVTDLEAGRKRIVEGLPKGAPKVTMTVLAVKAVVAALKEFPTFNASLDLNAGELVVKKYYHVAIAVDTERGLVVPVIRDADKKSIRDLAAEVANLAEKARTGKLAIDEMRGGTFTITNLGGIGGTAFTPIVNYPEVAILGMSRSVLQPVVRDGQVVPRLMLPLSLTYDHRVVDGADGARFTSRLSQLFSDPIRLLMES
jgi:pyruvate dehydrogenase E2 component (dihydrolipoamide acetyltransferase)